MMIVLKKHLGFFSCFLLFAGLFLSTFQSTACACSCTPEASAPACQLIARSDVVFIGESLELVPGPDYYRDGKFYRFRVTQVYKGLDPQTTEVRINYGYGSSCANEYTPGKTYIIFGGLGSQTPLTVVSLMCSGSRRADLSPADVEFLENYRQGKTTTMVYGKVLQWVTPWGRPREEESAPLEGAVVTLKNSDKRFTCVTKPDGAFHFDGIPEGDYFLSSELSPYTANPLVYKVSVIKGGCQEVFIQLKALASISGTLLDSEGKPAKNKRMELLRRNQRGEWYSTFKMWAQTDGEGNFKFQDIESGEYLLGYEIRGDYPSSDSAYPTLYYPGVLKRTEAEVITLLPKQELKGLQLALVKPHTERKITIKVVMPDGKPPGANLLQIFHRGELIQNLEGPQHGAILAFKGYQERDYEFWARYWVDNLGSGGISHSEKRLAKSEMVKLSPGKDDVEVVIVLSRELKSRDDH
jgi:hypothetical protein